MISGIFTTAHIIKLINFQVKNDVPSESLAKVKEENGVLWEKLREAEEKAQLAKNEVKNT
jgi:hypothetical protein